jgi:eukaryotic-like serine/threonine-protein kinase
MFGHANHPTNLSPFAAVHRTVTEHSQRRRRGALCFADMDPYQDPRDVAEQRIGTVLKGRWKLERLLGLGGSAWVYLAADDAGGQLVAIKVLHTPLLDHPEVKRRFVRESKMANLIDHPGVVRVLDDGMCGHNPFIAMEFLRGETLDERRQRKGGALPVDEVLWAIDQLLAILKVAHKKGIVHRDIKPENLFITFDRDLRLLDFGIARLRQLVEEEDESPFSDDEKTQLGLTLGTIDFMAPEQARGDWDNVGVQTDLWAVGATMFTLLTGRTVHDELDNISQMRAVISRAAPSVMTYAPRLPRAVADLVDHALNFHARSRWPDARMMRLALHAAYRATQGPTSSDDGRIPKPKLQFTLEPPPASIDVD